MNVSSVSAAPVNAASAARTGDAVNILVARKAMAIDQQLMTQLIQSATQTTPSSALPENLGRNIDVVV